MTDRDRLIELFKKTEYTPFPEMTMTSNLGNQFTDYALNCIVDEFLANDVVKVVRCKDCKYYKTYEMSVRWNGKTKYCCRTVLLKVNPTDFCSYGELKEREGK